MIEALVQSLYVIAICSNSPFKNVSFRLYDLLPVTFQFRGINLTYDNIRTSHRRANKNRKTPKCLTLELDGKPAIVLLSTSGHVILDYAFSV